MLERRENAEQRIRFLYVLLLGFFCGIIGMNFWGSEWILDGRILSAEKIAGVVGATYHKENVFVYVLTVRLKQILFLILFAFTPFRKWAVSIFLSCTGLSIGVLSQAAVMQYGLKGSLLIILLGMPQIFFYVPVFLFLIEYCYDDKKQKRGIPKTILKCFLLTMVTITGVWLESYVNLEILKKVLRFF